MNNPFDQIDYRLYLVKLYRILGIPVLVYFSIEDLIIGNYIEAFLTILILTFVVFINFFLTKITNKKILYRIGLLLLISTFLILMHYKIIFIDQILWMFVVPIPLALLLGLREGIIWNIGLISLLYFELLSKYKMGFVSLDFFIRYIVIFITVSSFSLTTEHVRKLYNDLAVKYSTSDPLTGAVNRFGLDKPFENLLSNSLQKNSTLAVILCDIDNLKEINDSLGHLAGDNVLKEFVNIVNRLLHRETDILIRYGGDEFLIVLPYTSKENALTLTNKIINEINKVSLDNKNGNLSCSFGIASTEDIDLGKVLQNDLVDNLIHIADIQLYKSKEKGGNKSSMLHT